MKWARSGESSFIYPSNYYTSDNNNDNGQPNSFTLGQPWGAVKLYIPGDLPTTFHFIACSLRNTFRHGTQSWREDSDSLWQKGICHKAWLPCLVGPTSCHLCPVSESSRAHPHSGTVNSGLPLSSPAEVGTGPWAVG